MGLYDLMCFKNCLRNRSPNTINARWVITWKMIGKNVGIKCTCIAIPFADEFQHLRHLRRNDKSFKPTSGKRCRIAKTSEFVLSNFDVNQTFAKIFAFDEFSALICIGYKELQFDVSKTNLKCFRQNERFDSFNPANETLAMFNFNHGFNDAPRVWKKELHAIIIKWMSNTQIYNELKLYCVRGNNNYERATPIEKQKNTPQNKQKNNTCSHCCNSRMYG